MSDINGNVLTPDPDDGVPEIEDAEPLDAVVEHEATPEEVGE